MSDHGLETVSGRSPDTLFAGRRWFKHWLGAFGGARSGFWESAQSAGKLCIAYSVSTRRVGQLALAVAGGAANAHTPRFDTVVGSPSLPDLRRMMRDLGVAMLEFPFLSPTSRFLENLHEVARRYPCQLDPCERSPFVDCRGSWDDYWSSRSKNARGSWGSKERKLFSLGMEVIRLETLEAIEPMLPVIYSIEASGWKGKMGTAIMQDEATRKFYDGIIRDLAAAGHIRLFLLRLNGDYIAFQLTTLYRGMMSWLKNGYREDFAKLSPGQVLQLQLLRWAFTVPDVDRFDMLGGGFEKKVRWATGVEDLYTLRVYRNSLKGRIAWARYAFLPRVRSRVFGPSAGQQEQGDRSENGEG